MSIERKVTFCRICEATCGLRVDIDENRIVDIKPDPERHEDGRIRVDDRGRTTAPSLYAAGDICRRPEHRYVTVAMADGVLAARTVEEELAR